MNRTRMKFQTMVRKNSMCEHCKKHVVMGGLPVPDSPITRPSLAYWHMIPKFPLFIPMQPRPTGPCQPKEPQPGPWEVDPSHLYPDFWNHRPGDPVPFWWGRPWVHPGPPCVPMPKGWMPPPCCCPFPRQAPVPPCHCCGAHPRRR